MVITCISDTHELHDELDLPGGDVLLHAGDVSFFSRRPSIIADFNDWLRIQPYRYKVVIPGNHDSLFEQPKYRRQITNANLLMNSGLNIGGLKIWGAASTHLDSGAFAILDMKAREALWNEIPSDSDIVVTHVPPYGILDGEPGTVDHGGCPALRRRIAAIEPRLHVFGHVHCAAGKKRIGETLFVNASLASEDGDIGNPPITLTMKID